MRYAKLTPGIIFVIIVVYRVICIIRVVREINLTETRKTKEKIKKEKKKKKRKETKYPREVLIVDVQMELKRYVETGPKIIHHLYIILN